MLICIGFTSLSRRVAGLGVGHKRAEHVSKIGSPLPDRLNDNEPLRIVFRQDQMNTLVANLGVLKAEKWRAKRWGPHFSARDFSALFLLGSASAQGRVARRSQSIQADMRLRMPNQAAQRRSNQHFSSRPVHGPMAAPRWPLRSVTGACWH